jgi:hypothetical protein
MLEFAEVKNRADGKVICVECRNIIFQKRSIDKNNGGETAGIKRKDHGCSLLPFYGPLNHASCVLSILDWGCSSGRIIQLLHLSRL